MNIDIQKLKALAKRVIDIEATQDQPIQVAWDEFEAAANPAAVLELIAEIERLEERNVHWIDQANAIARGRHIARTERDQLKAENDSLRQQLAVPSDVLADCEALRLENEALRKDAELSNVGRAKLAGALSRLRAKHNDWTLPDRLPEAELVWCGCGDGYPSTSYGAGYMAANGGACENCHAAPSKEAQS